MTASAANKNKTKPTAQDVAAYLFEHPDFLEKNQELLAYLVPPKQQGIVKQGDTVADFQYHLIHKLQEEVHELHALQASLFATAQENQETQERVLEAMLTVLHAASVEDIFTIVTRQWPEILGVDAVHFCCEEIALKGWLEEYPEVIVLPENEISLLFSVKRQAILRPYVRSDSRIFGRKSIHIISEALIRIKMNSCTAPMMLVFGAAQPGTYAPAQDVSLITFLGKVLAATLDMWHHTMRQAAA